MQRLTDEQISRRSPGLFLPAFHHSTLNVTSAPRGGHCSGEGRFFVCRVVFTAAVTPVTVPVRQQIRHRKKCPPEPVSWSPRYPKAKVYQLIVETLQELGIPNAGVSIHETTTLVQDGCDVGQSFVCGHVRRHHASLGGKAD